MATKKIEIRPKGDGTYSDVLYPLTSADQVEDGNGGTMAGHLTAAMPHQFTDATDARTYRYGFKMNAAKDGLVYVYEEVL